MQNRPVPIKNIFIIRQVIAITALHDLFSNFVKEVMMKEINEV